MSILQRARQENRRVILLMGRSYHLDPLINHGVPQMLVDLGVDVITEDAVPLDAKATLDNRHVPTQWELINRCYHAARWAGQQEDVEVVQLNSFGCGPDAFTLDEVRSILDSLGKGHTVIRVDEIESTGSTRLRLRSLIETLRAVKKPQTCPSAAETAQAVRGGGPPQDDPRAALRAVLRADHLRADDSDGVQHRDAAAARS